MGQKIKIRYVIALISFFGIILNHSIKNLTNVTLLTMAEGAHQNKSEAFISAMKSPNQTINYELKGDIPWSKPVRNQVQLSFFVGYLILQLPSGRLSEIFGSRRIFGPAILMASILSILFPSFAYYGSGYASAIRFLQGFCLSVTFPSMHSLLAKWSPINERSKIIAFVYSGSAMGVLIIEVLSGYLSATKFLGGWPAVYYMVAVAGTIWTIFWYFLVFDSPETHPMIDDDEIKEINLGRNKQFAQKKTKLPVGKILTSIPVYALIVGHTTFAWTNYTTTLQQPIYMHDVLDLNSEENGLVSGLPHLMYMAASLFYGYVCDKLRASGRFTITTLRKFFNSVGSFGPAICFMIIPSFKDSQIMTEILFGISMTLTAGCIPGTSVIHVDMTSTFAGSLMGLSNIWSNVPGVLVNFMSSLLVSESRDVNAWAKMFYLTAGLSTFGGVFFLLFASAKLQPWDPEYEFNENNTNNNNNYGSNDKEEPQARASRSTSKAINDTVI